jgi:hypothetical protein
LTIKLTRHVAAAKLLRESSVRIIRLSTIRSLEQNLRTKTPGNPTDRNRVGTLGVLASFFSCQRALALGAAQSVPRPAERPKIIRTEIKNPASSAGPIRLSIRTSGFARCSTRYYPVFVTNLTSSPERARLKLIVP